MELLRDLSVSEQRIVVAFEFGSGGKEMVFGEEERLLRRKMSDEWMGSDTDQDAMLLRSF